jgi:hypothetical protein
MGENKQGTILYRLLRVLKCAWGHKKEAFLQHTSGTSRLFIAFHVNWSKTLFHYQPTIKQLPFLAAEAL